MLGNGGRFHKIMMIPRPHFGQRRTGTTVLCPSLSVVVMTVFDEISVRFCCSVEKPGGLVVIVPVTPGSERQTEFHWRRGGLVIALEKNGSRDLMRGKLARKGQHRIEELTILTGMIEQIVRGPRSPEVAGGNLGGKAHSGSQGKSPQNSG